MPLVLAGISIWQLQFAGIHMDTARDWAQALAVAEGRPPTVGPNIGRLFDLSPLWFYVLSAPLALGFDFHAVALWLGALFATQYWWAYCLGERLRPNAGIGALTSAMFTLPNWAAVWMAGTTHTTLVVPAVLATLLALLRYHEQRSVPRLAWLAVGVIACIHAHPTTGLIGVLALGVLCWRAPRWDAAFLHALVFFAAVFAPFLWFGAISVPKSTFGADSSPLISHFEALKSAPKVLWGAISRAPSTQLTMIANAPHAAVLTPLSIAAWSAVVLFAGVGLVQLRARQRTLLLIGLTFVLMTIAATSASRSFVTFYMIGVLAAILPLGLALGLAQLRLTAAVTISLAAVALHAAWAHALVNAASHNGFQMNVANVLDLGRESAVAPWPMQPVWSANATPALAALLCASDAKVLHGPAGPGIDLIADVLMHRACPDLPRPILGGTQIATQHRVGVPCVSAWSAQRTGSVCWHPVSEVIRSTAMAVAHRGVHPPRAHAAAAREKVNGDVQLRRGEHGIISHHRMEWARVDQWTATISAGATLVAHAPWWRIYRCEPTADADCWLSVQLLTNDPDALDVVRIAAPVLQKPE